ncbi:hypothetical protein, variant [Sphaeroforma arctica JP610]|uniref:VWFD domain-containing protein n=1 Tax=Sphaeroforma arctica JP610 TaxID=667725 RepID=A0A0L0FYP1_9EUKA|nr:hypothetical protein, variant [Sphaeroforma arctica JP610]KNC81950.1 hypothetical protein, variant [Sphaeroforma arctica JP610]|eukprot:XP_014155852.1 hypothetical protein, variant [Sphaeroforma arctica JP610]
MRLRGVDGGSFWMDAGTVRAFEVNFFEKGGDAVARLEWRYSATNSFLGSTTIVPYQYMVPSMTAEVLVTTHNTITVSGKPEIEYFEARLSEKPTETVYVDIFNLAGGDIFGVDKCVLVFTPENWETPQRVHVAPILDSVSNRKVEGTMWITLEPRDNDQFAPGGVAVIDPATAPTAGGLEPGRVQCKGWGDPHYTMFDGSRFNLYAQGMFTLFRNYDGDLGVQTYLQPCDDIGAQVSCTFIGYMTYKGTKVQFSMNQGTSFDDIWDPTVQVDILADGGTAVGFTQESANKVVFSLPNGIKVTCTTGFYRTQRTDGNHWRYLNYYVEAPASQQDRLLGLCGYFNGDGSDENTDASWLATEWIVPSSEWIINGGMNPMVGPSPSPQVVGTGEVDSSDYVSPNDGTTIDNFVFEPACNPNVDPRSPLPTPVPGTPPVVLIPPALNESYVPIVDPPLDPAIQELCEAMINSEICPKMSTQDITGFVEGCTIDTQLALLDTPPPEAAEPFFEACTFDTANVNECNTCTALQTCDETGSCVTVGSNCGSGCGTPEQGTCDENNAVCVCTENYSGDHCGIPDDPCTASPCENGGVCTAEGLQPMCSCPENFTGVRCQLYPVCSNRLQETGTTRLIQLEVYTKCVPP